MQKMVFQNPRKIRWMLLITSLWSLGHANPSNPTAIQGTITFEKNDSKTCVITLSDNAFIDWDQFSVSEGEFTEVHQPSSKSVAVFGVRTNSPSTFLGTLRSNGYIFLVNPNGVLIGESGEIDASGFLASSLPACPCPLIDGEHDVYIQGDSKVPMINKGRIKARESDVYLIGHQVRNHGSIDAPKGTVALAAGRDVILNQSNGQKIGVFASPIKEKNEEIGLDNSGTITAVRAELKADGNSFGYAIFHSGSIHVIGTSKQKGEVNLVSEKGSSIISGEIIAENQDGTDGEIQILGNQILNLNFGFLSSEPANSK